MTSGAETGTGAVTALDADAELLFGIVREAGSLALAMARKSFRQWRKPDGTPVTEADIAVDGLLKQKLTGARPNYGWLSEESLDDSKRLSCQRLWIADPIDGTRAFASHGDEWCVAVALIDGDRPVIGAIYRPVRGEFYQAISGAGAYLNGRRLVIGGGRPLRGARIIGNAAAVKMIARKAEIDPVRGSNMPLAMRLALVAAGGFDAALSTTVKHDWDLAAGDLLVHEAGGTVTGLSGRRLSFNRPRPQQDGYIAAALELHRSLISFLGG